MDVCLVEDGPPFLSGLEFDNLASLIDLEIIRNEQSIGIAKSRNLAIRQSDAEILAFLDDDAVPSSTWIESIMAHFAETEEKSIIGGLVLPLNEIKNKCVFLRHSFYCDVFGERSYTLPPEVNFTKKNRITIPYACGGNSAFPREAFARFGLFNEEIKAMVDVEFASRSAGEYMYVLHPGMRVFHDHSSKMFEFLRRYYVAGKTMNLLENSEHWKQNRPQSRYFASKRTPSLKASTSYGQHHKSSIDRIETSMLHFLADIVFAAGKFSGAYK